MKLRLTVLAAALLVVQTACSSNQAPQSSMAAAPAAPANGTYANLTVPEYRAMAQTTDLFVVNVHIPFEGDLPGTEASIAFNEIQNHLDKLPADKAAPILLYCKSGRMSEMAAETLAKLGYTSVYSLAGGMNAWSAAGHTLARAQ